MFAGFNVTIDDKVIMGDYFYSIGEEMLKKDSRIIENNLKNYICDEKYLNGALMAEKWFPQIDADIFLSHSHKK